MNFRDEIENLKKAASEEILEIWLEVVREFGVEYKIEDHIAIPVDEKKAQLKNFGSGTKGVKAEFWYPKALAIFRKRLRDLGYV